MEKLVELLNEYDGYWDYNEDYWPYMPWMDRDAYWYHKYYIISKEYWFIERLVENDYINMNKVERDAISYFTDESPVYWDKIWTTRLIMMLSVSNSPIKDLIYYLGKEDEHYTEHWWYKLVFNAKKS